MVWKYVRAGHVDLGDGLESLRWAAQIGIESVGVGALWESSLARAVSLDHPAYDMLFVQLAHRESIPLATYDKRLLAHCAEVARRPSDIR